MPHSREDPACQTQALDLQPAPDSQRPQIGTWVHLLDLNPTAPPGHARVYLGSSADVRKVYQALHGQVIQIGSDTVSITVHNDAVEAGPISGNGARGS